MQVIQEAAANAAPDGLWPDATATDIQDAAFIHGVAAYRRHPAHRTLADPATMWREGGSRLLDYGRVDDAPPVLFVPSLINRAYVLDLQEQASMVRWLAGKGLRPLLLDWGWPDETERQFTMTDYVAGRLERALVAAVAKTGQHPVLAGYCMGGTLGVAAAQRRPDLLSGLVLLAAPWDFHAPDGNRAALAKQALMILEPILQATGTLPVDYLQALFTLLEPWGVANKYRAFSQLNPASARAILFVALEDWLNDGVPLAAPVARACLNDWYVANAPARGNWRIAGLPVDPTAIELPTFVAIPQRDRIVPPEAALPLGRAIRHAVLHQPKAGHIGMAAGPRAETVLWQPLLLWLQDVLKRP